jgi:hypothetical protein
MMPEDGEKLVGDPRLGKRARILEVSKRRGHDVFGRVRGIRRFSDGCELWSVADGAVIVDAHSSNFELIELHWLVVGYVSPGAKQWIEEKGGQVLEASSDPPLVAVGLAYNPAGAWVWTHGRQEHRQGIEFWNTGEIQEVSTGISLQYRNSNGSRDAEYCSAETNYLILPDEEFDPETRQVKEHSTCMNRVELPSEEEDLLSSLDDHPF